MLYFVSYRRNCKAISTQTKHTTILVAPLNWGLGHTTRCIPIINALLKNGYQVLLGSDGASLSLLQNEFPQLEALSFPSYGIRYSKKGSFLKWKLVMQLPSMRKAIKAEERLVSNLVDSNRIQGIISDNRLGVWHKNIPSVYITHQLNVFSGNTSLVSTKLHQRHIAKYTNCWVPDMAGTENLSGTLGHLNEHKLPIKYIGTLSRMRYQSLATEYDICCILSGPEPQRSILEQFLVSAFSTTKKKVALIKGVIEKKATSYKQNGLHVFNFLESEALQNIINKSDMVVARSGYTTIMDMCAMQKPVYFIPTPGQFEQQYLAKRMQEKGCAPFCAQEEFTEEKLKDLSLYKGLPNTNNDIDFGNLFSLFESK